MNKKDLTIGQHYVPQVYLRNFCTDKSDRKPKVWEYDKTTKNFALKKVSSICTRNFFYDLKKQDVQEFGKTINDDKFINFDKPILDMNQPIENFFANFVEGDLFNNIKEILDVYEQNKDDDEKMKTLFIADEQLYLCSLYMNYQWMRTPRSKQILDNMDANANKEILEILDSYIGDQKDTEKLRNEIKIKSTQLYRKKMLHDIIMDKEHMMGMANIFYHMYKWVFAYSKESKFITSDYPAIIDQHYNFSGMPLAFPLSPELCLLLISEDDNKNYERFKEGSFIKVPNNFVHSVNDSTLKNADRFVICSINKENDINKTILN